MAKGILYLMVKLITIITNTNAATTSAEAGTKVSLKSTEMCFGQSKLTEDIYLLIKPS